MLTPSKPKLDQLSRGAALKGKQYNQTTRMTNATCLLLKYDSRYNDLVIVRYFATDTAAMLMIETNAKRNVVKAYILQPILPKSNASSRTCMIENGTPSKQERKSLTAMLRMKNVEDDREKVLANHKDDQAVEKNSSGTSRNFYAQKNGSPEIEVICHGSLTLDQTSVRLLEAVCGFAFHKRDEGVFLFRCPSENMVGKSWTGGRYFENAKYCFMTERAFCLLVFYLLRDYNCRI